MKYTALLLGALMIPPAGLRAEFEDLGGGARSVAMGGAMTALGDSAQTSLQNPASLGLVRRGEISTDYGKLLTGLEDGSSLSVSRFNLGLPLFRRLKEENIQAEFKEGADAVSDVLNLSALEGLTVAEDEEPDNERVEDPLRGKRLKAKFSEWGALGFNYKQFSLSGALDETTLALGWGRVLRKKYSVGFSIKNLSQEYAQDEYTRVDPVFNYGGESSASALSFDLGALWNMSPNAFLGIALLDLLEPDLGLRESQKIPRTEKLGLGYKAPRYHAGIDYSKRGEDWIIGSGYERMLRGGNLNLRTGYQYGSGSVSNLSVGFGFKLGFSDLDYAFLFPLSGVEGTTGSHRFSLLFKFGHPVPHEADPGSLEQAYLQTRERLLALEAEMAEIKENRDSLEKILVEESALRIQEQIESAKELAQTKTRALKADKTGGVKVKKPDSLIRRHRVKKGDTLQLISIQYYGDASHWRTLYRENKAIVGRKGVIKTGQVLIIPPLGPDGFDGEPAPGREKNENIKKGGHGSGAFSPPRKIHTVQEGDTLQSLSQEYYGSPGDWKKIYTENKDKIIRGVPIQGAELVIP